MNVLTNEKRAQILNCLIEGCSMRSAARLTGAAKVTIERLMVAAGKACAEYHNQHVRNLKAESIQCDEIWAFCGMKEANVPRDMKGCGLVGDVWLWTGLDADTKLIIAWHVGTRGKGDARWFMDDLSGRLASRPQMTTDGHNAYPDAIERAFGSEVDYAKELKEFEFKENGKYSPSKFVGVKRIVVTGKPDKSRISTSFVERSNLTWRMSNRRFTRLTNAFSKKVENHQHMISISMMHYNFCRIHTTLRVTPAMEAGLTNHVWSLEELASLVTAVCE